MNMECQSKSNLGLFEVQDMYIEVVNKNLQFSWWKIIDIYVHMSAVIIYLWIQITVLGCSVDVQSERGDCQDRLASGTR